MELRIMERTGTYKIQKKCLFFWYTLYFGFDNQYFSSLEEAQRMLRSMILLKAEMKKFKGTNWTIVETFDSKAAKDKG